MGLSDKSRFLSGLDGDEKTLFAMLYDRALRSEKFGGPMFGDFLSMDELGRLWQRRHSLPTDSTVLFGGYGDAERKMIGFNAEEKDFPICAVKVTGKGLFGLSHRDYLGALMGLGIERSKLGDIIVGEDGAIVFAAADIASYIVNTLSEVGRSVATAELADMEELDLGERQFKDIKGTVASLRLDSICAMLAGKGRSAACELIKAGRVYVNGICTARTDIKVSDGDIITIRGFGKAAVEIGGLSKKERIFVTLKKYV